MSDNNNWRLLFTPNEGPYMNMAIDEALAVKCGDTNNGLPTIRFYTWKAPSCSIGYFQKIEKVLSDLNDKPIPIVRRPTGGGIVFHGNDLTFSIIKRRVPGKSQEDIATFYKLIGKSIISGLSKPGLECKLYIPDENPDRRRLEKATLKAQTVDRSICSLSPARYDVLINGGKVAGYAARRSRNVFLCQGYLDMYEIYKDGHNGSRTEMIGLLYNDLVKSFESIFKARFMSSQLSFHEEELASQIREKKYSSRVWNYRK